ncbi:MAG: hypothetical protein AAGJ79_14255 [Verrucomicrobiota bacterium]
MNLGSICSAGITNIASLILAWNVTVSGGSAATIYNAVTDFSETVNSDTSTWSYRISSGSLVRDGDYQLFDEFSIDSATWDPDTGIWRPNGVTSSFPAIGANNTGGNILFNLFGSVNNFNWPDETIFLHPSNNSLVVLSWLAPGDGVIDVEFQISDMDNNGGINGVGWFVDLGDASGNLASGTVGTGGSSGPQTLNGVAVSQGDRLHFIIDSLGDIGFDATEMTASISFIPEPTTALLGLVARPLALRRRRK